MWHPGKQQVMLQSGRTVLGKKQQQPISVLSKVAKMGKQSEGKPVAGLKRSLESDESDSEDDDEEDEDDDDDDDDDVDIETLPAKKQKPAAEGVFFNVVCRLFIYCNLLSQILKVLGWMFCCSCPTMQVSRISREPPALAGDCRILNSISR